jgi:hypothetical protein
MATEQTTKPKHKTILDDFTDEQIAKIKQRKEQSEKFKVDNEWLMLAEFGYYYGWNAIQAVLDNKIDGDTMTMLLAGARKLDTRNVYDNARAGFIANYSVQAKNPVSAFSKATKQLTRNMKADI